jgi:hypothetical protein
VSVRERPGTGACSHRDRPKTGRRPCWAIPAAGTRRPVLANTARAPATISRRASDRRMRQRRCRSGSAQSFRANAPTASATSLGARCA